LVGDKTPSYVRFILTLRPPRRWSVPASAEEVERFEAAAGDHLAELGYPRGAPHPTPDASRAAGLVRASFAREPLAEGDRPPGSCKR
jgi:hypothetical protein